MTQCYVYGLKSTRDSAIRFIGQSLREPKNAYTRHLNEARKAIRKTKMTEWMRREWRAGHGVLLEIIDLNGIWNETAAALIADYRAQDRWLLNHCSGGSWRLPADVLTKIGAAGLARVPCPDDTAIQSMPVAHRPRKRGLTRGIHPYYP